jgi:SpoVK/Ycf46/Vps4 family AAA+-type ATPase
MDFVRPVTGNRPLAGVGLPDAAVKALGSFVDEARGGAGTRRTGALFLSGDSAKVKAAAGAVSHELGRGLFRVDLSAVASKFIGETEKNLDAAFAAAEGQGAILFFDEADALFGKRSEVKDSHDRFANIEVNYLLQKMESFAGVAIVATNAPVKVDTCRFCRYVALSAKK